MHIHGEKERDDWMRQIQAQLNKGTANFSVTTLIIYFVYRSTYRFDGIPFLISTAIVIRTLTTKQTIVTTVTTNEVLIQLQVN